MKKLRLLILIIALLSGTILYSYSSIHTATSSSNIEAKINFLSTDFSEFPNPESDVWVCRGHYATKYHIKANCRGLNNCKAEIEQVSKSEAAQDNYCSPCGWCSKYKPSLCK